MSTGGGSSPVEKIRSPSSYSGPSMSVPMGSRLSLSISSTIFGTGPSEQLLTVFSAVFQTFRSFLPSSQHPVQQRGGQWDILTSPVTQSISGLCFHNQECPRMSFCVPRPVTANRVFSEWVLKWRISSTTSVMEPASFGVPTML